MAIRDFKATEDGEWYIEDGDFKTISDEDAVGQGIRIRARTFLGEIYLDESVGVDYIDSILIKNPDPLVVRGLLSEAIAKTPDVTNVVGAQLINEGGRQYSIAYSVDTVYSDTSISEQFEVA